MIKKLLFLGLVLILTAILLPAAVLGASENEVNAAQKSAQYWVDSIAIECAELAQWQGAVAISPQPYENLDGKVNAYMFTVSSDKGIVGHMLVGSADYDYDLFEAGEAKPMSVPSSDEAILAIESLGVKVESVDNVKPEKLLYLGLDNKHALYNIGDKQIAVSLESKKASLVSNLKVTKLSPAEYQAIKKTAAQQIDLKKSGDKWVASTPKSSGYNTLPMSYYSDQPDRIWCGPCSGVSIMRHYRDYDGYSNLPNNNYMYDLLEYYMGVPTYSTYYGYGIEVLADMYSYETFNEYLDSYLILSDYTCIVNDINSDYPTGLLIWVQTHWRAIRGYKYNSSLDYYRVICTDSATSENAKLINWYDVILGGETVCIKDNG